MDALAGAWEISSTLSPLPKVYRQCQTALLVMGGLSLATTSLLFLHITYKLVLWKVRDIRSQKSEQAAKAVTTEGVDLSLGLSESHYYQTRQKAGGGTATTLPRGPLARSDTFQSTATRRQKPPNPLLLLIYNLILSDIFLSIAYMNNGVWLAKDAIEVASITCRAQGWNVSFGTLVTSGFLFAISLFSYFGIIRGYKPSTGVVITACAIVWVLSIFLSSLGLIWIDVDDFFRRQTLWCWIGQPHRLWRLSIYVWGFTTMCGTACLYTMIFYRLWREGRSSRFMPRREGSIASTSRTRADDSTPLRPSGHHPAFLIYPCIYMITGTPIMLGSLITPLETDPRFMGVAGALLAATGLLDSLLWSSIILFSNKDDIRNAGLDQFTFMRTPEGRTLGNIVFVQGGGDNGNNTTTDGTNNNDKNNKWKRASWHSKKKHQGWGRLGDRNSSQVSLPRDVLEGEQQGIQMDIVTSVVIEGSGAGSFESQSRDQSRDRSHERKSVESSI
ncbi:hypothetical protein VMCG_01999 [Cytospora schulzeri]|uniref:Glucose receptor Git3 N-terminal domain-containing protein n=1 Tax=Cytospora schulzeri TaxID=448051 RepID=A0A423X4H5_9PEZI|nr:hypothetical protein VMCG_01999 [Valsa malicola]